MLEFLFGFLLGVWAAQALPLPSVGEYISTWWQPKILSKTSETTIDHEAAPMFTGAIPTTVPT
jgi:hypothetical protein|tara:strand:+ start:853 stop:1041 length:189 start_codon:yes stop_codon:yes gene_type:complete